MKLTLISEADVKKHASREMAFDAVRSAFIAMAEGGSRLFPVTIGAGAPTESMVAIKSGYLAGSDVVGVKVGTYWPDNIDGGLANHGSTTLLLDPRTGYPMALVNAGALNGLRTAAANAVATDALARKDASTLLIVGTGHQARCELRALCDIRSFKRVLVWGREMDKAQALIQDMGELSPRCAVATDLEWAVGESDVITTVTTATKPLFKSEWVQDGTHISAMGADKVGKQELDPTLIHRAVRFADHPLQSRLIGEFQHLDSSRAAITAIGSVLNGSVQGRLDEQQVTLFDSSGIALQDIAVAEKMLGVLGASGELTQVDF